MITFCDKDFAKAIVKEVGIFLTGSTGLLNIDIDNSVEEGADSIARDAFILELELFGLIVEVPDF